MEEKWTVKVDKQVMSLLTITIWSNLVCVVLLVAINATNFLRQNTTAAEAAESVAPQLLSPDVLLLLSAVCVIWLAVRTLSTRKLIKRMSNVFLTVDGNTVSGISMAEPSAPSREYPNGRPFTVQACEITDVTSKEKTISKKHVAPALIIKTADDTFVVPGLEQVNETMGRLLRLRDAASNRV